MFKVIKVAQSLDHMNPFVIGLLAIFHAQLSKKDCESR